MSRLPSGQRLRDAAVARSAAASWLPRGGRQGAAARRCRSRRGAPPAQVPGGSTAAVVLARGGSRTRRSKGTNCKAPALSGGSCRLGGGRGKRGSTAARRTSCTPACGAEVSLSRPGAPSLPLPAPHRRFSRWVLLGCVCVALSYFGCSRWMQPPKRGSPGGHAGCVVIYSFI